MAEANVQSRVPIKHTTINQGSHSQGFLSGEAGNDVQLKALQCRVAGRTINPGRPGVDKQWHIKSHRLCVKNIHRRVIERLRRIGTEGGANQTQLGHSTTQFTRCICRRLQRQRGKPRQFVGVLLHNGSQGVIVDPTKLHSLLDRNEVQVGQGIRRHHLKINAAICHATQPDVDIHEGAANVFDAIESIAFPDLKKRRSVRVSPHKGTVFTRSTNRLLKHNVRMQIHHFGLGQSWLLHVFIPLHRN